MKKVLSALLICLFILCGLISCTNKGDTIGSDEINADKSDFTPVVRFVLTSDIHLSLSEPNNTERFKTMVNQIKEYVNSSPDGYGKLDAVVIAGDITNDGVPEQLSLAKSTFDSVIPDITELIITVGNHDWYHYGAETLAQFEKVFPDCTFTGDTVIGGYHFITIVNDKNGWDISDEQLQKADSLISAAIAADSGKEKPVFLITHIGATDTVVGTSKEADIIWDTAIDKLDEIAKKYENLVVFSGHTHFPANDEGSVYQRDYTSVNTGSLFYAMRSFTPDGAIDMPDRHNMSQCYVIELDENSRMRIRVWDVLRGEFCKNSWIIDSWSKEDFVYTDGLYTAEDLFFADDATVSVSPSGFNKVTVSFPPVPAESISGRVYEVTLTDSEDNEVFKAFKGWEYFNEDYTTPVTVEVSGLHEGEEYTVSVRAINSVFTGNIESEKALYSKPISTVYKAERYSDTLTPDLVNTVITENGIENVAPSSMPFSASDTPIISYDESIGKNVITVNGTSGSTVKAGPYTPYSKFVSTEMTFEAYFKVDAAPSLSYLPIISAQYNAAFGLTASAFENGKGSIDFRLSDARFRFKNVGFEYAVGEYYHVVAVYNGSNLALYVNGEKAGEIETKNEILLPTESAQYICFGASPNGVGECESLSYCTVAAFNLYSYAMDAEQVKTVYERTTAK